MRDRRMSGRLAAALGAALALAAIPATALAAEGEATISSGDTAWLLVATALVMIMLPGLALFYGGLVRRKNVLSTIMHSFFGLAIVSVIWVLWGYSLAFGPDQGGLGLIGGLDFLGFAGVGTEPDPRYAATIPHVLFAAFQLMFAAITPALITGAFAERKRFASFVLFTVLWSTLVYSPLAHWVWAPGGWLRTLGALDYAGGTVVHISSGVSAFVVAMLIGRRVANGEPLDPHDVPMTVLGAGLLWFGWFGFNAGSALAATGQAANALLVTNTAAGAATLTWVLASSLHKGKTSVIGAACGAVAGLVAITPASGFVAPGGAVVIGALAGGLCYSATLLRERLRIDDALDVFAVHGVGGTLGAIATGVFAVAAIGGVSGAIEGNVGQVGIQLVAVVATYLFAAAATFLIVKVVDLVIGLRVSPKDEEVGLDLALHGEVAYQP
ncbi:MAG TPA: ammonium transporter [Candidatus Limnocylindrales bacterium]|nr:ammonium transporter [Candidatus Limnocylindrales bacterium]